ncbi:hypothetical protein AAFF_G00028910 [Aldrovandia affinis]|uniref:Elapor1/2 mannose 6-phosphate receptor homology domain-containing protein n=1 Tax=Aldrovandia affinis TaxID=143900 RepID=A0AAD7WH03_9TELE|nr:hypothetical protein AAFF_G00028910 [Aldrovandia affinis]
MTDLSNENLLRESSDFVNNVETFICQSTIIPSDGRGFRTAVSSQSISLADIFLGATMENSLNGISVSPDLFPKTSRRAPDVNFFYRSPQTTSSCDKGRNAVINSFGNCLMPYQW